MLLKRIRQEGNETANSLEPELADARFQLPGLLRNICYQTRWLKNTVQINSFTGSSGDLYSECKREERYSSESSEDLLFLSIHLCISIKTPLIRYIQFILKQHQQHNKPTQEHSWQIICLKSKTKKSKQCNTQKAIILRKFVMCLTNVAMENIIEYILRNIV